MKCSKSQIKIVLVEPSGEINLGSIARLCENFGVDELRLVSPRCNPLNKNSLKMAVHGHNFLKNAKIFSNLLDAINDCSRVVATCGRIDHGDIPIYSVNESLHWLIETSFRNPVAIVFGREDRGLTNQELLLAQKVISIEVSETYPSLNISHAVAVVLYELNKAMKNSNSSQKTRVHNAASAKDLEYCLNDAEKLLLQIGFLYRHTAKSRMAKIKTLLQRGEASSNEVSLIRGIIRQCRWFIDN